MGSEMCIRDSASRIRSAAQYLCAGSERGRRAASSRTSSFSCFSAVRHGRKSVRAAQRRTVNICTKRYGRKTASFPFGRCLPFCTVPRYRRNWCAATATGQSAEYASARYSRNAAHVHRRALYPARAADDARFHEWKHPDHAAEPCFSPAVRRHGAAVQRSPHGRPLYKSGASYTHNAGISGSTVFQPRNWYASALDRAV